MAFEGKTPIEGSGLQRLSDHILYLFHDLREKEVGRSKKDYLKIGKQTLELQTTKIEDKHH